MSVCPNCGEDNPDRAKFCLECATPLRAQPAPPQEARKTVTVVFCDLVGSTSLGERLDSESLREVMDRYFTEMRAVLERHGGIVEKYIGDAIMAIFGLPRAHEDDALRAVRAATDMSVALERLNAELERDWGVTLANRTGANTGEAVVGDPSSGQRLATGDAVNVAARLEQAAPTNSVLIGEPTYRLLKDAVTVHAVEPLALKGKSERLPAFALVEINPEAEGIARRLDAPLVGRLAELEGLLNAFETVTKGGRCHLVTVLGEAGVGKSRLVAEIAERLYRRASVLKGRCLSYGKGITFWPLAEIVRQAAAISEEDSADEARRKIGDLLSGTEGGIVDPVASMIGLSSDSFPIEESFWAARRLLEHLASDQPLVVIFEDIHWAEPTLLDWISYVVDLAQAPILVICAARPELRDERPSWDQPSAKMSVLELRPLSSADSNVLIGNLLGSSEVTPEIRARITSAGQGNPLFVEQIISMWIDDGTLRSDDGSWVLRAEAPALIPPTISALLSARLDRLDREERAVVAGASVVGQVFYRGAVEELCPPLVKPRVATSLAILEEKQFIRPDPSTFAEEQAFAFRHVLIRDAAYAAMLKRTRAELHERFASWLTRIAGERIAEYEEIVGYHLEQAYEHFRALGRKDDRLEEVGRHAAHHLSSAGKRALGRGDMTGAAKLLERAVAMLPTEEQDRVVLLADLAVALTESGSFAKAESVLRDLLAIAERCNYGVAAAYGRLESIRLRGLSAPEGMYQEALRETEQLIPFFERSGDKVGLAKAWNLAAHAHWDLGGVSNAEAAWSRAAEYAEASDDRRELAESLSWLAIAARFGPSPALEAIEVCDQSVQRSGSDPKVRAHVCDARCGLEAMRGWFDKARETASEARTLYDELGLKVMGANLVQNSGYVEMLAGDPLAAEKEFRWGYERLAFMGEKGFLSTVAAELADALYAQGRLEEAEQFTHLSEEAAAHDDVMSQATLRSVRAKILAQRGELDLSVELAREAVRLADRAEQLDDRARFHVNLGEVLSTAGFRGQAIQAVENGLSLFSQKDNIVSARRARQMLGYLKANANR